MSGIPSSTWYMDFFTELPNEFWRRAVPPEVTVEEIDFVERRLGLAPRSRILDVPCGSGRHSLELARRGHRVTGVDLSAEAIGHARRAVADPGLDVEFVHADMREIPRDNGLDAVVCLGNSFGYLEQGSAERGRAAPKRELNGGCGTLAACWRRGMTTAIPLHLWSSLMTRAQDCIDILIYAGLFFTDGTPDIAKALIRKGESGVRVRLILGDPDSEAVALRGAEEGVFGGVAARVRLSLTHLQDAIGCPGVEIRLQSATLYNSIFRFDETLLVNTHAYGAPASQSPVIQVQRVPGGRLFDHYLSSFDKVWNRSVPAAEKGTV